MDVSVAKLKADLSKILRRAAAGEEVVVTKHGKPLVKIEPANGAKKALPRLGAFVGQGRIADDFDLRQEVRVMVDLVRIHGPTQHDERRVLVE